ncbi:MAG TPA: hypothetical protein VG847_10380 [Chitinophagaceae bacterium]|nr:hypothetical protein [Chitinophagaceae bacterium]
MKRFFSVIVLVAGISFGAFAQQKEDITKTTTPVQKVHNTFSSHKHYNGYKVKKKTISGHKTVHKVNDAQGTVTDKSKKAGDLDKKVEKTHK